MTSSLGGWLLGHGGAAWPWSWRGCCGPGLDGAGAGDPGAGLAVPPGPGRAAWARCCAGGRAVAGRGARRAGRRWGGPCLVEVLVGAALGWSAALIVAGARQAGEVVGRQAGLSAAALFDPEAGDELTPAGPPLRPGRAGGLPGARRPVGAGRRPGRELPRAAGRAGWSSSARRRAAFGRVGPALELALAAARRRRWPWRWRAWPSACSAGPRRRLPLVGGLALPSGSALGLVPGPARPGAPWRDAWPRPGATGPGQVGAE